MTTTKKIANERIVICHKLASNGGALAMMCGRYEEPWPNTTTHWKIDMVCACYKAMDMYCQ